MTRLVKLVIGSAAFSLVITLIVAALATYGVIDVLTARFILFFAWLIGTAGVVTSEIACSKAWKHVLSIGVGFSLLFGLLLVGIDRWALAAKSGLEAHAAEQQKPNVQQTNQGNGNTNINGNGNTVTNTTIIIKRDDPKATPLLNKLDEFLKNQERLTPTKLLQKYPVGYVIFNASYSNTVFPYKTQGEIAKWNIDWNVFRYTQTDGMLSVRTPDIRYKSESGYNNLNFFGNTIECAKKVGDFCNGGVLLQNGNVQMLAEILDITQDGVVFLFGFRHSAKQHQP